MYANTKTIFIPLLIVCITLITTLVAQAQTSTPAEPGELRQALQQEAREVRATLQASSTEVRQAVREERRATLSEQAQKRIINLAANISNRVDALILRFTKIADRLDSRIKKLNAQGVDTTSAEASLSEARATLETIKAKMATIDADVYGSAVSESPRESWPAVKQLFKSLKTDLQTAQGQLRETVSALKAALAAAEAGPGVSEAVRADDNATTSEALTE